MIHVSYYTTSGRFVSESAHWSLRGEISALRSLAVNFVELLCSRTLRIVCALWDTIVDEDYVFTTTVGVKVKK